MIKIIALVFAFLQVTLGTLGRFKYVWQGNKVKRRRSSADVSRKFLLLTHLLYWVALGHNILVGDAVDVVFWSVGVVTTAYANVMVYRYYPEKYPSFWSYLRNSFDLKNLLFDTFGIHRKKPRRRTKKH